MGYVWQQQRAALPRWRADLTSTDSAPARPAPRQSPDPEAAGDARVFSGDDEGEARRAQFAGPDGR